MLNEKEKKALKELTGSDHFPDPYWKNAYDFSHSKLSCKGCSKQVSGNGTVLNPWRHKDV